MKPEKTIYVEMTDPIASNVCLSYDMIKEELESEVSPYALMFTHCTNFFSFNTLDKGWNVVVRRTVDGEKRSIDLYDLLHTKGDDYVPSQKEIRREHDVHRMLIAGALAFK